VDGLEVLRIIKEEENSKASRHHPDHIRSGKDVARAYDNHVNSYLVKPVGFEEFSKLMNDLGFYWLGWNTHPRIQKKMFPDNHLYVFCKQPSNILLIEDEDPHAELIQRAFEDQDSRASASTA
jgi:hypothetical protein